jgi:exosortase
MNIKVYSPIIIWSAYLIITIKAIIDFISNNPKWNTGDEILLYATIIIVLYVEREGIISTLINDEIGYPVKGQITGLIGIVIYLIGRSYPLMIFEIWSFFIIASGIVISFAPKDKFKTGINIAVAGTILVILGKAAPELLSSKLAISIASMAAIFLNATLFPVVANGVYLYFGPYIAEVTHACSGMNSIFSIFALSLLYLKDNKKRSVFHLAILVLLVIPVAILTNIIRVIMLVLSTWFIGDWFSSGPFHETIGVIAFIIALGLLYCADIVLFSAHNKQHNKISGA